MPFNFSQTLIRWHAKHGRTGMPWQSQSDPYAIWVSEIMLQQTQVSTVIERYQVFMKRFPTVHALANAKLDEVMALWSGLGYYSRARNLHRCAIQIVSEYSGQFPKTVEALEQLPGIGRSTAGAIAAFAFHLKTPILDANVKRVISRFFGIKTDLQHQKTIHLLWDRAWQLLPKPSSHMPVYTQALMDFGATWCTPKQARCISNDKVCPMSTNCVAYQTNQVGLIPAKKKKKESPAFETELVLICYKNSVLLQKRPPKAIWGGLYSLLETPWVKLSKKNQRENHFDPLRLLHQVISTTSSSTIKKSMVDCIEQCEPIDHVFSHRRLRMNPWLIKLNTKWKATTPDLHWVSRSRLSDFGIPQPIRVFLESNSR